MKWKELIIGALVALLITITGGVTVWKFTKEPPKPDPTPYVVYQIDAPANFKSESKSLVFNTIRIGNLGDKSAQEIVLSIEFPKNTEISDFSISNSSGSAARENQKELKSKENEKIIYIKSLMPNESVTVSILTSYFTDDLKVSARYSDGLAEQGELSKRPTVELANEGPKAKEAAVAALILGLLLPVMFFQLKRLTGGTRSINNSAFMMLHQGLIEDATKMLESELSSRGATSFELANLGLCKALSGDKESAKKLFAAAELYAPTELFAPLKHIKALVAFNRAISSFEEGDLGNAKAQFWTAAKLSKSHLKKYVKYSVYGQSIVNGIDGFNEFKQEKS
ncbi:MAG: hypothetical protein RPU39_00400 [Candidatus Sedimenticola sp. (ex Thyasira tokunagai)]